MSKWASIKMLARLYLVGAFLYLAFQAPKALPFVVAFVIIAFSVNTKKSFVTSTARQERYAQSLDEFPYLDRKTWDATAQLWRDLGFEAVSILVIGEEAPRRGMVVLQRFVNKAEGAVADISQTILLWRVLPVASAVFSYWGDKTELLRCAKEIEAQTPPSAPIASPLVLPKSRQKALVVSGLPTYSYGTHNTPPSWIRNLYLHPQAMGTRLVGATPDLLWETHLERRGRISQVLGEPLKDDLITINQAQLQLLKVIWRERFQRQFLVQLFRAWRMGTTRSESFGDLENRLEK